MDKKFQITKNKKQITNKFQYSKVRISNGSVLNLEFVTLNLFAVWNLVFGA
jgi:hypothetical protein